MTFFHSLIFFLFSYLIMRTFSGMEWQESILPGVPIEHITFTHDNKYLALSANFHICVHDLKGSNSPVRAECNSPIVSLSCNSMNQIITVTQEGELLCWEVGSDELRKKDTRRITTFQTKIVVWSHSTKHSAWITEGSNKEECDTLSVLMNDQSLRNLDCVPRGFKKDQIAVTDTFLVYCYKKEIIKVYYDVEDEENAKETFTYDSTLAGLTEEQNDKNIFVRVAAFSNIVVASLAIGKVYVWNHRETKKISLSSAFSLHWHKVSAPMAITPFGGLISAGSETVLCKWSLKTAGAPSMLSRLQASVVDLIISDDGSLAALLMEDNSLHIVLLSTMSILRSLPTITYSKRCTQTVFMRDTRTNGKLVMNGTPGWIQWLNLSNMTTIKQACLSLENAVEGDMSEIRSVQTYYQLENIFLGHDVAVSLENIINFSSDNKRLRFWKRISEHEFELIDSLAVPVDTQFISSFLNQTTANEKIIIICRISGKIELWYQNEDQNRWLKCVDRCQETWENSTILLTTSITSENIWVSAHRNGSNTNLVVWNILKMDIVDVIAIKGQLLNAEWVNDNSLIISSSTGIICWNIKTLSPKWAIEQPLKCHISGLGCFAWENNHVIEFDAENGNLLNSFMFSSRVEELVAVKQETNGVTLVAKTVKGIAVMRNGERLQNNVTSNLSTTPFSRLSSTTSSGQETAKHILHIRNTKQILKLFDGPCHSLPPLSHIAPLFISSCLAPPVQL